MVNYGQFRGTMGHCGDLYFNCMRDPEGTYTRVYAYAPGTRYEWGPYLIGREEYEHYH